MTLIVGKNDMEITRQVLVFLNEARVKCLTVTKGFLVAQTKTHQLKLNFMLTEEV